MTLRKAFAGFVILALSLTVAGCGATPQGDAPAKSDDAPPRVGYISYGESTTYVHTITQGIEKAAKAHGVDVIVCDSAQDAEKALQCAIRFKQQNVQGIINYQGDATAAARICAQGPDVPVIAITVHQAPCEISWTGADNAASGQIAGKALGEYFKTNFDCKYDAFVAVEVTATGKTGIDRIGGYKDGFKSVCGDIQNLRAFDSKADAQIARSNMTDILTSLPNAKRIIIVGMADGLVLGAISAAASANRLDQVFASAQGLDASGVCAMKKYPNSWIGDTAYFPENYGEVVIPAIVKAIKGEKLPAVLPAKAEFVTPASVDKYYADVKCQ
jgi:ribose transport system substrate-binding protein